MLLHLCQLGYSKTFSLICLEFSIYVFSAPQPLNFKNQGKNYKNALSKSNDNSLPFCKGEQKKKSIEKVTLKILHTHIQKINPFISAARSNIWIYFENLVNFYMCGNICFASYSIQFSVRTSSFLSQKPYISQSLGGTHSTPTPNLCAQDPAWED